MKKKIFGQRMIGVTFFHLKSKSSSAKILKEIKQFISHRLHEHGALLVCMGLSPEKKKIFIQSHWEGPDRRDKAKAFNKLPEIIAARKKIAPYCKKIKDHRYDQIVE